MNERQRFEILLEDMTDKIKAVAEGHQILRREIQLSREETKKDNALTRAILGGAIEDLRNRTNKLDERIDELKKEINALGKRLDGRIDKLDGKVDKLDGRIDVLDQKLSGKIDDVSRVFADHELRIRRLEKKKVA